MDDHLFIVRRAAVRQILKCGTFAVDPLGVAGIAAADDLIDEATIGSEIVEVGGATQPVPHGDDAYAERGNGSAECIHPHAMVSQLARPGKNTGRS
ncbi:hypothetical protein ABIF14_007499 [Bradyrhizobium elkanii]